MLAPIMNDPTALTTAMAVGAALVACAFVGATHERWLLRRQRQYLAWSVSLTMFFLAAGALAWGSAVGWSPFAFRLFFAFGAVLNVPFLALGQLYVQIERRIVDRIGAVVALGAAFSFGVVLVAPMKHDRFSAGRAQAIPQGSALFGVLPRVLAAVASGLGATVVFVGAVAGIIGLVRADRRPRPQLPGRSRAQVRRRAFGLALIAGGTIVLSLSGLLNSVVGAMRAFSITLTVGVTLLFAGFMFSSTG